MTLIFDERGFRFVFTHRGSRFGLTQDRELVERARQAGCPAKDYEREPGVLEWEVNLGKVEPDDEL